MGERVNRPTFGSGINQLIFAPNNQELATATQYLIQGNLQQWLSDLIIVKAVNVRNDDSTLHISILYIIKKNQQQRVIDFTKGI